MILKTKLCLGILLLSTATSLLGQTNRYLYKRDINGISSDWHKVTLPNDIFGKANSRLTDIRIYGITPANDTIEAPYILRINAEKVTVTDANLGIINASYNSSGYYFTLDNKHSQQVNQIKLSFNEDNFDWLATLEGSHNQQEWFTVCANQRIVSIANSHTSYTYSNLSFPETNYRYLRILVKSSSKPTLQSATASLRSTSTGVRSRYELTQLPIENNKSTRESVVYVTLKQPVPVSIIKVNVSSDFDYYRPITIERITDSIKTEQGWRYSYSMLESGTLTSFESNEFHFSSTTAQKLRITVQNADNTPLNIGAIEAYGYTHELIARFTEKASYFLAYGNSHAYKPNYDITLFTNRIPESLAEISLGNEQSIATTSTEKEPTLPISKVWLWVVMAAIAIIIGGLTISMLKKEKRE
ncbi:MAG: DUF3999 family protein [Bacteroidales bacterium]|nr:DUF3999 family protein [Bacteroidales bacterium]MBN2749486.1 DUF3999 family protein [Bacteroidales bacterium]